MVISIHAPTRGATFHIHKFVNFKYNFNPRSHEGSDDFHRLFIPRITRFQSTLPRGERQELDLLGVVLTDISIHAPTRGATFLGHLPPFHKQDFNPRSHEGSDLNAQLRTDITFDFNPRSHEGSDGTERNPAPKKHNFNPRSHEGSDCNRAEIYVKQ